MINYNFGWTLPLRSVTILFRLSVSFLVNCVLFSLIFVSLCCLLALVLFLSPPVPVAHTSLSNAITENTEVFLYSLIASSRPLRFYTICLWEQEVCHRPVSAQSLSGFTKLSHSFTFSASPFCEPAVQFGIFLRAWHNIKLSLLIIEKAKLNFGGHYVGVWTLWPVCSPNSSPCWSQTFYKVCFVVSLDCACEFHLYACVANVSNQTSVC